MQTKTVRRKIMQLLLVISLLIMPVSITPARAASPARSSGAKGQAVTQDPFTLHGTVKDQADNPVQTSIYVTDMQNNPLANQVTDAYGEYSVTISVREEMVVNAFPMGIPQNLITLPNGYHISKYFELTKGILPDSDSVEVDFALPPAAALQLDAYSPAGNLMNFDAVYEALNPTEGNGYGGRYGGIYGVFPMSSIDLPVPEEPSIGMFRWAWPLDNTRSQWEPCFGVPTDEATYIMMLWEVPGIGAFPLRADNLGHGYTLGEGETQKINLVYEFAETEHRRMLELKGSLEGAGHQFSSALLDIVNQANAAIILARSQGNEQAQALSSYEVLRLSIKAKEQMTVEAAGADIPKRQEQFKVVVQDPEGAPVPGATVTYRQDKLDFVITGAQGEPFHQLPFPGKRAGIDIGFQSLTAPVRWNEVSPQAGVFDFSAVDAMFRQWQGMGYEVIPCLAWLGSDNVPAWAAGLDFADFQKQVGLFVKKAVENFSGKMKYLIIATEINLQTIVGSRYVSVDYPSNVLTGVQPADLIELIRTAFQAGRDAHSDIKLGYYGIADYNYNSLNPLPWGAWPLSYSFFKSVLDAGVRPDYIGIEMYPGTLGVPQDLSNVADTLKAYHDLSGLPVMVAETLAYSSRSEDYGEIGPTPQVVWHEGYTRAAQSEWETSYYKIAMSQPYVLGVQMFQDTGPDNPPLQDGQPVGDCIGDPTCVFRGISTITEDGQPKPVFYAMQDLIASWKASGSAGTNANGEASFAGMDGMYSIEVISPNGLVQSFTSHLSQDSSIVTIVLDTSQALWDLQQRLAQAQKKVDWSSQLGRLLDYPLLRSQLAQARSALANGSFASASSLADQVLQATAITIDGSAADWQGIPPILAKDPGGVLVNAPGIDLKAMYAVMDDDYLYILEEVYDPPILMQPGAEGGVHYPTFNFDLPTRSGDEYALLVNIYYRGQIDFFRASQPSGFIGTYYSIAVGNALELKIPRSLLGDPSQISACGFVSALENGAGKIAKWFDGCAQVWHPLPATYLPILRK